jgi:putative hemolysin
VSDVWPSIVMVVVFVLIGGAFSGAEIALVSLRESQVRALAESGRRGRAVQKLLADPNRFLAAVQVGVTVAGFFSAAFGASTLAAPVAEWLTGMGVQEGLADTLALVLVTVVISYVSLVAGELTPKRLALQRAEGFSLIVASPLNRIATLSRPVIWLLSKSTDVLVRLLGGDPKVSGESISQEELRDLVAAHESLSSDERRHRRGVPRRRAGSARGDDAPHRGRLPGCLHDGQPGGQAGGRLQLVALPRGRP